MSAIGVFEMGNGQLAQSVEETLKLQMYEVKSQVTVESNVSEMQLVFTDKMDYHFYELPLSNYHCKTIWETLYEDVMLGSSKSTNPFLNW